MKTDFEQIEWDESTQLACRRLAELAYAEDLAGGIDPTAAATMPADAVGAASIVAREPGILAGLPVLEVLREVFGAAVRIEPMVQDGAAFAPGAALARLEGNVRDVLALERTALNFLGRLSGVASLTRRYVDAIAGTGVRLYDTRKTTPGWRRLEKYAVRCGGGHNHRGGLYGAILVKDNHIASLRRREVPDWPQSLAELTRMARKFARELAAKQAQQAPLLIEVEVDSLAQLLDVLAGDPDLVLLDNMDAATLQEAAALRNLRAAGVELEASGGVNLENIRETASTGIERISVGALTHQATWLDLGLDWDG